MDSTNLFENSQTNIPFNDLQINLQNKIKQCKDELQLKEYICLAMMKKQEDNDWKLECITSQYNRTSLFHPNYKKIKIRKDILEQKRENYEKTVGKIYSEQAAIKREIKNYEFVLTQITK